MNEINLFAASSKIPGTYSAPERSSLNSRLTPVTTPTWCGAFKRTGRAQSAGMQMFPLKIRSRGPRKRGVSSRGIDVNSKSVEKRGRAPAVYPVVYAYIVHGERASYFTLAAFVAFYLAMR